MAAKIFLALLLALFQNATERPYQPQLDLEPMLHDSKAQAKLIILHQSPKRGRSFRMFFVHGDGSLVLQMYPGRPMGATDIPTCTAQVSPAEIQDLIRTMIERHFWSLPEKQFIIMGGIPSNEELAIHSIFVTDGLDKGVRSFAVGKYLDKQESIPEDFSLVERKLEKFADLTTAKPCHFASALEF